jgi:hypothetical protein
MRFNRFCTDGLFEIHFSLMVVDFLSISCMLGLDITGKQQDSLNKWCKKNIRSRRKLVALFDYNRQRRGKKWRCYEKSALNPEGTAYDPEKKSKQYYTRHKKLKELLGRRKLLWTIDT